MTLPTQPPTSGPETNAALIKLIVRSVEFANWAGGEGIDPSETGEAQDPAEFVTDYIIAVDLDPEKMTIAEHVRERLAFRFLNQEAGADGWCRDMSLAPKGRNILLYCPDLGPTNPERVEFDMADSGRGSRHSWATAWMLPPSFPVATSSPDAGAILRELVKLEKLKKETEYGQVIPLKYYDEFHAAWARARAWVEDQGE